MKLFRMLVGAVAIGAITAILWPAQPQSVILSISFVALWCALMVSFDSIAPRER